MKLLFLLSLLVFVSRSFAFSGFPQFKYNEIVKITTHESREAWFNRCVPKGVIVGYKDLVVGNKDFALKNCTFSYRVFHYSCEGRLVTSSYCGKSLKSTGKFRD